MQIKRLMATTAIAATALMAPLATAEADPGKYPTKVTIKGTNGDYYGYVKSDAEVKCAQGREVKVYKMLGSTPRPKSDLKIGTDTTGYNGSKWEWSIGNSGYKHGYFYAKAGKTANCKGDYSKVISR